MEAVTKISEFSRFGSSACLERVECLMDKLGNPQDSLRIIHVAGTNGKGSVCRYIYEVLEESGYKTGLYTSPFLEVFNERIEFDHKLITDEELDWLTSVVLAKVDELRDEGKTPPTEFDIITAVALLYFREKNCDYVILEVGLGGRGDSTNVVRNPLVCAITSIGLDHTDRLGETPAEIAWEKAGIIKEGVPVVSAVRDESAFDVIKKEAELHNAELIDTSKCKYSIIENDINGLVFSFSYDGSDITLRLSMEGEHQVHNGILAFHMIKVLEKRQGISFDMENLLAGFEKAVQPGRFEIMCENPCIVIDGAHNAQGAKALRDTVKSMFDGKKILMVTGMLSDKDYSGILDSFLDITEDFIASEPDSPRSLRCNELADMICARGGRCICMGDAKYAVRHALSVSKEYDVILFAGSLYLIGEIRRLLKNGK